MSTRSYLSIGDVLSLLREEFPDVTISKIRFLESQGLVDPERSPSGYRKFYDHDVDRLRWVLRQQRDQFLPLKVIRDRLAAAGNGVPEDEPGELGAGPAAGDEPDEAPWTNGTMSPPVTTADDARRAGSAPATADRGQGGSGGWGRREPANVVRFGSERRQPASGHPAAGAPVGAMSAAAASKGSPVHPAAGAVVPGSRPEHGPVPHQPTPSRTAPAVAPAHDAAGRPSAPGPRAEDVPRAPSPGLFAEQTGRVRASGSPAGRAGEAAAGPRDTAAPVPRSSAEAGVSSGERRSGRQQAPSVGAAGATGADSPASVLSASLTGVSLTPAELSAATGLPQHTLDVLCGFGLIAPMEIAGDTFFDEEALTVSKLVVEFAKFGIEPRHLRLYRNAVDREAGLVEQVITPLLRQRNPEARQRAIDAAAELTRLGQGLRAALVRTELRRQFGG